jgi:spore coat polysaccharide biosynthesis protein SpsF (cytidylyltransferase family)
MWNITYKQLNESQLEVLLNNFNTEILSNGFIANLNKGVFRVNNYIQKSVELTAEEFLEGVNLEEVDVRLCVDFEKDTKSFETSVTKRLKAINADYPEAPIEDYAKAYRVLAELLDSNYKKGFTSPKPKPLSFYEYKGFNNNNPPKDRK